MGSKYILYDKDGKQTTYKTYEEAREASYKLSGSSKIELETSDGRHYHWGETTKNSSGYVNSKYEGQCNTWNDPNDPSTSKDVTESDEKKITPSSVDAGSGGGSSGGFGSKKGGDGCFLKGTKVLTSTGYKDIDKIEVNDEVLTYNELTKVTEYKKVSNVYAYENMTEKLYTISIVNKKIEVTHRHQLYVKRLYGHDWIAAEDLKIGDLLMDKDGKYYPIRKISSKDIIENVYNLDVSDNHNYYVTDSNILVHNRISKY